MKLCKLTKIIKEDSYRQITEKMNLSMQKEFSKIPFSERIVFVPHCLRNTEKCSAKELGAYYICASCGSCKINSINKKAKELGYKGLFILKGGRTIEKLVEELKPRAVMGIACYFEGAQGFELLEKKGKNKICVQFVSLAKDGCADTDVNLDEVLAILSRKS